MYRKIKKIIKGRRRKT